MTVRTWGRLAVVALVALVVQVGVLDQIVIAGAHADLFLLLAISAGLVGGPQRGAVMAFALGLVADVFVQTPYGLSSLSYVLVAFAVGLTAGLPSGRPPLGFRLATALLGGMGGTLLYAGLGTLIGQPSVSRHQLAVVVAVVTAGCVLLAPLAYRLLEWTVAVVPGTHRDAGRLRGRQCEVSSTGAGGSGPRDGSDEPQGGRVPSGRRRRTSRPTRKPTATARGSSARAR